MAADGNTKMCYVQQMNGEAQSSLLLLRVCGGVAEANLLRSVLEAHDIPCVIQGENHRSLLGVMGAYIDLRLLVPAPLLPEARHLLSEFEDVPRPPEPPERLGQSYRDPYPLPPLPEKQTPPLLWRPLYSWLAAGVAVLVLALAMAIDMTRR